tara:strand:- start:186 stop:347 length:162 start_codon:yes stop_codon:yes gene_type:complete
LEDTTSQNTTVFVVIMADFTKDQIIKWLVKRLASKMDELRELRKKLHEINSKK